MISPDMPKAEVREFVKRIFPYSHVQPWLSGLIKFGEYNKAVGVPATDESLEGQVYFDVDKFWDELTERLYQG